jgi:hypothetical protein
LATLQFQSVALHPTNPQVAFGGMQDNSKASTSGSTQWIGIDRGDGGFAAIDPFDPKYWYGTRFSISRRFVQFQRNTKNGSTPSEDWPITANGVQSQTDRVLFYMPFITDPSTPGRLYLGTNRLYRTNNRGDLWSLVSPDLTKGDGRGISAIAVLSGSANLILAGTSDGNVQVTTNGGTNWTNLTKLPLPNRYVSDLAIENGQTYYAAFNGFNDNTPSTPGHVFKTTDGGDTWSEVSKSGQADGLPDLPVQALVLDGSTVYVGTDLGVYRSTNGGGSWEPFSQGFPNVAVFDLALQKYASGAKVLVAATHGRGMWRVVLEGDITPVLKNRVFVPVVMREAQPKPGPTPTPGPSPTTQPTQAATATHTPTPTQQPGGSTATPTPTTPAGSTATPTPTPTSDDDNTPTPTPSSGGGGITGQVEFLGFAEEDIDLKLLQCTSETSCTTVGTTQSDSTGGYAFTGVPSLSAGQYYRVAFENKPLAQGGDDSYVDFWRGTKITSYSAGSSASGGTLEIQNVILISPFNTTESLPVEFSWFKRLSPDGSTDSYSLRIFDLNTNALCSSPFGTASSSIVTLSFQQSDFDACGLSTSADYGWYVRVMKGSLDNGYGESYYYQKFNFSSNLAQTQQDATATQAAMFSRDVVLDEAATHPHRRAP